MEERGPEAQRTTAGTPCGLTAVTPSIGPVQVGPGSCECGGYLAPPAVWALGRFWCC